jgi:hypothetical protein
MTMMARSEDNNGANRQLLLQETMGKAADEESPSKCRQSDPNTRGEATKSKNHKIPRETDYQRQHCSGKNREEQDKPNQRYKRKWQLRLRHYTTILFLTLYALTMDSDANMSDSSSPGKRPAPAAAMAVARKRHDGGQETMTKLTRFTEPEPDETTVSTKINRHVENPFLETLTESVLKLAKTPYETLFGNDKGDTTALHDDLQTIIAIAGRWVYDTAMMTQEQLKKLKEASSSDPILTIAKWTKLNRHMFKNEEEAIQVLSNDERQQFKTISSRLSFTKPKVIADTTRIQNSKIPGTHASRAWRGAINILGSAYHSDVCGKNGSRSKRSPYKLNPQIGASIADYFAPNKPTITPTAAVISPSVKKSNPIKQRREKASETAKTRPQSVRLMMALKLGKHDTKTPNDLAFEGITSLYEHYLKNDDTACIYPWRLAEMDTHPAITQVNEIPKKMSEFKKIYAEGIRPKSNSTCWFKMRVGSTEEPVHFTSTNESNTQDFFNDTSHMAYLCTVQDSDDTVDLCDFIYSGPFSNPNDFQETLKATLKEKFKRSYRFGCRIKKSKEIQEPKVVKDWLLKPNMLLHLEVDRRQAKSLKNDLYHLFNKMEDDKIRPGGYNFRVLPDKSQMRSGTRGDRDRVKMLRKHQANVQSLTIIKSYDIKDLDEIQECNHGTYSLRQLLLGISNPIVTKKKNPPKLFFTVDYASSGADKEKQVVYFTAYHDRKELAAKVVDILPAFIEHNYGRSLAKKWCHPNSLGMIADITFLTDEDGNDTGEWTTEEDEMGQDILDEDMGVHLDFDGIDMSDFGYDERVLHNADDASVMTFGSALGAERNNGDQLDPVIPGADSAAIAPHEGAMSGATSG